MENGSKRVRAVYSVVPKQDGKELWMRMGSSFDNRDGSITLLLDAMPLGTNKLIIKDYQPRDAAGPRMDATRPV